jgi:hypothetical protein
MSIVSKISCKVVGHNWSGCKCSRCGETRDEAHEFQLIEGKCKQKCSICEKTEAFPHQWSDDKCTRCGITKGFASKHLAFLHLENAKNRTLLGLGGFLVILFVFIGIMATLEEKPNSNDEMDTTLSAVVHENEREIEKESEIEESRVQAIYNGAVGKPAIDVYNELKNFGYTVNFKHAVSKMDFTDSLVYSSDPTDTESYIPWIISDLDSHNEALKTASFLINTQEMLDQEQKKKTVEDILQAKLDRQYAWQAVESYGKREYPYGFKLRWIAGKLAETVKDENTWFLKAECEFRNEYGTWLKNLTCEALVSGTTESPRVIDFTVY